MSAVLDIQKSLEAANGNATLAKELFTMLIDELKERAARIEASHQSNDLESLEENAHKLYGATAYCVVPELRENSGNLENALKENRSTEIEGLVQATLQSISEILDKAPGYLEQDWA